MVFKESEILVTCALVKQLDFIKYIRLLIYNWFHRMLQIFGEYIK